MGFDRVNLKSNMRSFELDTINSIAKYLKNFNDALLVENELTLHEIQTLERIFA
ncbi:hypothetical protein BPUTSESOX_1914 [uncultured Gammaproteobacteria bacterium]|jgi:hypothetical protein|nr:hypothetical protein [uncultured Gammaproteobacteria bacterium]VVH51108.1 hypothetical protein BPUTSESOX_1914 [uncultured Gammaproteobacteria bacterium]